MLNKSFLPIWCATSVVLFGVFCWRWSYRIIRSERIDYEVVRKQTLVVRSKRVDDEAVRVWRGQYALGQVLPSDEGYIQCLRVQNAQFADWESARARLASLWSRPGRVRSASLRFEYDVAGGEVREHFVGVREVESDGAMIEVLDVRGGAPVPARGPLFQGRALAVVLRDLPRGVTQVRDESAKVVQRCAGGGYYWGSEFQSSTEALDVAVTARGGSGTLSAAWRVGGRWLPMACVSDRCAASSRNVDPSDVVLVRIALPYAGCPSLDEIFGSHLN